MRQLILMIFLAILAAGCVSTGPVKQEAKSAAPPDWLLAPPADSAQWFWGVGEGDSLDAAKRAALKDVAAKLRVSISGKLESQLNVSNDRVDRRSNTRISEEVQKTEFSHYAVEKSAESPNGFYVLVKVDRQAFLRDTRSKLDTLDEGIQKTATSLSTLAPIEQFVALRRLQPTLSKAEGYAQLLVGAQTGEDGLKRLASYQSLQQKANDISSQLVFHIQSSQEDRDVAQTIAGVINENGMRADFASGGPGAVLAVSSSGRTDEIYGSKIFKLNAGIVVRDNTGKSIASRDYSVSGTSRYDFKGARQNALQKLAETIRSAGPLAGLGFNN